MPSSTSSFSPPPPDGGEMIIKRRLLWGRHAASMKFWPVFEEVVEAKFKPSETVRLYKSGTWNPATLPEVEKLAKKIDYALIEVGA